MFAPPGAMALVGGNPQQGDAPQLRSCAVEQVLAAPDCYAAIGAQRGLERPQLCLCYVSTAVQVHPAAAGGHPEAERAFLLATAAWEELRSEQDRRSYDAALDAGRAGPPCLDRVRDSEQAQAVFQHAWSECLCGDMGSNMTEFAQVLSRGQELMSQPDSGELANQSALPSMLCGLALSAGLYGAGVAAAGSGLPLVGRCISNMALFQGAGQLAATAGQPEVVSFVKEQASSAAQTTGRAREKIKACSSGLPEIFGQSCLGGRGEEEASSKDSDSEAERPRALLPGDRVVLCGLNAAELNGRQGVVLDFDEERQRFMVQLEGGSAPDGRGKLIRRANLQRLPAPPPTSERLFI